MIKWIINLFRNTSYKSKVTITEWGPKETVIDVWNRVAR